jgi:glutamate synthase (NADPH) small chain
MNIKERVEPQKQSSKDAVHNFEEVYKNYTKEEVVLEASRCLNCKNKPCVQGCPINNNIPLANLLVKNGDFKGAYKTFLETNQLSSVCGRVCQQELQCEKACTLGKIPNQESVAIGRIERFLADYFKNERVKPEVKNNDKKVAIIGSGPAGITCASILAKNGFDVTIYEKDMKFGGLLTYGIPNFCLPNDVVLNEIDKLKCLGVKLINNAKIESKNDLDKLIREGNVAVFIAHGANKPRKMNIDGEDSKYVISAAKFLKVINAQDECKDETLSIIGASKKIVVVGGGNVAIDCDRAALRMGAEHVYNVYRRTEAEMPARKEEYLNAKNENVDFQFLTNPTKILLDEKGKVFGIDCIKMELGEPDSSGRRRPIEVPNSNFVIKCDLVVMALGSVSEAETISKENNLKVNKYGFYEVNEETMETNVENIYAGGDCVTGPTTVVLAIKAGRTAANSIIEKYK